MRWLVVPVVVLAIAGCANPKPGPDLLAPKDAQMKLRSFQSRSFDVSETKLAMRAVIATLQDLGFIIERANEPLGLVTAARFGEPDYQNIVAVTVTIRQTEAGKATIRVNAIYNNEPIEDPKIYQNFFATVERAMFLTRQ